MCRIAYLMRLSCSPSNKIRMRRSKANWEIGDGCGVGWHSVSVNGFCFRAKDSTNNTLNSANSIKWRWPSEIRHSRACRKTTISSYIMRDKSRSCQFYGLLGTRVVYTPFLPVLLHFLKTTEYYREPAHPANFELEFMSMVEASTNCRIGHRYPCTGNSIGFSHSQ